MNRNLVLLTIFINVFAIGFEDLRTSYLEPYSHSTLKNIVHKVLEKNKQGSALVSRSGPQKSGITIEASRLKDAKGQRSGGFGLTAAPFLEGSDKLQSNFLTETNRSSSFSPRSSYLSEKAPTAGETTDVEKVEDKTKTAETGGQGDPTQSPAGGSESEGGEVEKTSPSGGSESEGGEEENKT
ncbi:hypothetical protein M153_8690003444, partial [Pseudoloma neurophilia]